MPRVLLVFRFKRNDFLASGTLVSVLESNHLDLGSIWGRYHDLHFHMPKSISHGSQWQSQLQPLWQ